MRRRRAVARGADAWVVAVTVSCSSYSGQKTYNNSTINGWGRPMEAGNLFVLRPTPPPPSLPPRLPFSFPPTFRVSSNLQSILGPMKARLQGFEAEKGMGGRLGIKKRRRHVGLCQSTSAPSLCWLFSSIGAFRA